MTEPPLAPVRYALRGATLRIGRGPDSPVRIDHPAIDARHAMLLEREDGWWITAPAGRVTVNGRAMEREHRLAHGDILTFAPGAAVRFDDPPATPIVTRAGAAARDGTQRGTGAPAPPRRRRRWRMPRLGVPSLSWDALAPWLVVLVIIALLGGGGWFAWKTIRDRPDLTAAATTQSPLSVEQAVVLDSLLAVSYDHIERGQTLLEFRANSAALEEFASAVATITASSLRTVPYVQERAEALRASVADIYRGRNLSVPNTYAGAKRTVSLATAGIRAALSVEQFASAFAAVQAEVRGQFGKALTVTGSDHPEHLSLYGKGGALDIRSSTLSPPQVEFVVASARRNGIRVKDFSQDAILRAQIAAAIKAGVPDRAGTGLHLHLDRFANRRDRYTVP